MISVTCTCGETYHADEQHVGSRVRCRCGKTLEIFALTHSQDLWAPQDPLSGSADKPSDQPAGVYPRRQPKIASPWLLVATAVATSSQGLAIFGWRRGYTPAGWSEGLSADPLNGSCGAHKS